MTEALATAEFALLAAALARPPAAHHRATIAAAAADPGAIDWDRFVALVDRHRVAAMAFDALSGLRGAMPDAAHAALRTRSIRDRAHALRAIAILDMVQTRLGEAGIAAVSVKGPTLGQIAFGDATIRQCRDIDFLIPPDRVEDVVQVMRGAAFHVVEPDDIDDPARLALWRRLKKDMSLIHRPSGVLVELHWRLNNNPHLLPDAATASRRRVRIGAIDAVTLGDDDLLLYLCVHGSKHQWFRLKWLADVYAILAQGGPDARARMAAHARAHGLGRVAQHMFDTLDAVFGPAPGPAGRGGVARRALAGLSRRLIARAEEPEGSRFHGTAIAWGQLLLRGDRRYLLREIGDLVIDWPTVFALGGRRVAYPLAIVSRPAAWLRRKLRFGH